MFLKFMLLILVSFSIFAGELDDYLVSDEEVERVTGEYMPVNDHLKYDKASQSWLIPCGCNKG